MKSLAAFLLAALLPLAAFATDSVTDDPVARWQEDHTVVLDAAEADPEAFQWIARPIVVFADTALDPRFTQQMELLEERIDELAERDVVIITDTDPAAKYPARVELRPRGFMLAVLAKDGTVMLRKPFPWDVREISRAIDKLPLRQQEIRDRRAQP